MVTAVVTAVPLPLATLGAGVVGVTVVVTAVPLPLATLGAGVLGVTVVGPLATLGAGMVATVLGSLTLVVLDVVVVLGLLLGGDPLVVVPLEVLLKPPVDLDVSVGFVRGSSLDGLSFFLFHMITNTITAIVITTKITMGSGVEDAWWTPALSASDQKRGARRECGHSQRSAAATGRLVIYDG